MCEFQQLFLSKEGYIILCRHCGCFQLCYGKMVLDLSKHDFEVLRRIVNNRFEAEYDCVDEDLRQIIIPTPHQGLNLLISLNELRTFRGMLEEAAIELETFTLLSLFNA